MGTDRSPGIEESAEGAIFCARHRDVETYLRCGKCGTPICPRCLVQTPVGARCPDCAHLSRLPTFNITREFFARGMIAACVSGAVVGVIWALLTNGTLQFGLFAIVLGFAIGWAISEPISWATNRKRGLGLQVCAVLGVALAFLVQANLSPVGLSLDGGIQFHGDLIAALIAAAFGASRLRGF